jgi:O-antigen biosynthesis protein WbqP
VYARLFKPVFDRVGAAVALVALSPVLAAVAVAIRIEDGRPVLFRQERIGAYGTRFTVVKFRSMPTGTAALPSDQASNLSITAVGRLIRRTNLDELPQLWNIIRGNMSFVGPRPALPTQEELVRLRSASGASRCRPGLTGLAQISSYDGMPVSEKAALDQEYARRVTAGRDLGIVIRTFGYLVRRPPVY